MGLENMSCRSLKNVLVVFYVPCDVYSIVCQKQGRNYKIKIPCLTDHEGRAPLGMFTYCAIDLGLVCEDREQSRLGVS